MQPRNPAGPPDREPSRPPGTDEPARAARGVPTAAAERNGNRWGRTFLAFLAVAICYVLYDTLVVPRIEPLSKLDAVSTTPVPRATATEFRLMQQQLLRTWFGPDDWEITQAAKILQTPQGILVLQHYQPMPDGALHLFPCTLIFLPRGDQVPAETQSEAMILRAPEGAVLRFDRPVNLAENDVGRPVGGRLPGPVTIVSAGKSAGPEDDLHLATRDLELNQDRVTTSAEVQFHYGPQQGRGTGLTLELLKSEQSYAGIRVLQLQKAVSFQLQRPEKTTGAEVLPPSAAPIVPGLGLSPGPPVFLDPKRSEPRLVGARPILAEPMLWDIQCAGPFRFHFVDQSATFHERVQIVQKRAIGPSDRLTCTRLDLFFRSRPPEKSTTKNANQEKVESIPRPSGMAGLSGNLELRKCFARGTPVRLDAPSQGLAMECEQLEWDAGSRTLKLRMQPTTSEAAPSGAPAAVRQVLLQQGPSQMKAASVQAQLDEQNEFLAAELIGPGEFQFVDPKQPFFARWDDRLTLVPEGQYRKLSLWKRARIEVPDLASLQAEAIHLWLLKLTPPGTNTSGSHDPQKFSAVSGSTNLPGATPGLSLGSLQPRLLRAESSVRIESRPLHGLLDWVEFNFEHQPVPVGLVRPVSQGPGSQGPANAGPGQPADRWQSFERTFDLQAPTLRAVLVLQGSQAKLADLLVEGPLKLEERTGPSTPGGPLRLLGQKLRIQADPPEKSILYLWGQPNQAAEIASPEVELVGPEIGLDRGQNLLWINGAGRLKLPVRENWQGQTLTTPAPLIATWTGGMQFDGRLVRLEKGVEAHLEERALFTDRLEVEFDQRIDFAKGLGPQKPRAERLRCFERCALQSQTFQQGRLLSEERLQVRDLVLHPASGLVEAAGPGWLERIGLAAPPAVPMGSSFIPQGAPEPVPAASGLQSLQVRFQQGFHGNFQQKEVTFEKQVEILFGPIEQWSDRLDADHLGPRGVWLRCAELTLRQAPNSRAPQARGLGELELEARGNVQIEGQDFLAEADRLTYAQRQSQAVLEGINRDAKISLRKQGQMPSGWLNARKILYWRESGHVKLEDARGAQVEQIQRPRPVTPAIP